MKKKILKIVVTIAIAMFLMQSMQSCALLQDESFRDGFRQGWNTTAPEEYRY